MKTIQAAKDQAVKDKAIGRYIMLSTVFSLDTSK
jgi:hypothetical protein